MNDDNAHAVAQGKPATGCVLGGRSLVGQILRAGGLGAVFAGELMGTGRGVSLKLVHGRVPALSDLEHRFEREARIASNVHSKHIVQVFDAGRDEVLGPFIAMELLQGEDLEERLNRAGRLPSSTACAIAFQVARGLEKAHAARIAHRDLKPANIFLVESDEEDEILVKVLDFGIAKSFDGQEDVNARLTREGTTLGTPLYMSPEQARGREDIDERSDIYSLGAVLYEMLSGRSHVPELPNYNQLVIHIATVDAPRVSSVAPDVDPRIDRLVADMLVGDRRDRLQTMKMVRERLAPILGGGVRQGSISDASGSFAAGREPSSVGFSSARIHVASSVAPSTENELADSEEVFFFERENALAAPEPLATSQDLVAAPPSSRDGEAVELFDRASLRLAAVPDRTSSGAHVIDAAPSVPRVVLVEPVRSPPPPRGDAAPPPPARRPASRRALFAAGAAAAVFVTIGSVELVTTSESPRSAAASAAIVDSVPPRVVEDVPPPDPLLAPAPASAPDAAAATPAPAASR